MRWFVGIVLTLISVSLSGADELPTAKTPNRSPITRPDLKRALEDLKERAPRIPPPSLTDEETATLGEQANSLEARLRLRYLPHEVQRGRSRENDPNMSLTYEFKTMMFWIVARVNNCHY